VLAPSRFRIDVLLAIRTYTPVAGAGGFETRAAVLADQSIGSDFLFAVRTARCLDRLLGHGAILLEGIALMLVACVPPYNVRSIHGAKPRRVESAMVALNGSKLDAVAEGSST
jgi:hypothetical protein